MYISMYILNVRKKVLGVIKSFEVASQRPPILFLPIDNVLVDCSLCFTHRWTGMAPSYKEMSLQLQKRALGLLLARLEDECCRGVRSPLSLIRLGWHAAP